MCRTSVTAEDVPMPLEEQKEQVKKSYAEAIVAGNKLGFTDDDWNEANELVDKLMRAT